MKAYLALIAFGLLALVALLVYFPWSLSTAGQAAAAWIYTAATIALLGFVIYQAEHTKSQLIQLQEQILEMRATRDLESFRTFTEIWDDERYRDARRRIYAAFGKVVRMEDGDARRTEFEKLIVSLLAETDSELRKSVDLVIYRSNLAGILWGGNLLSQNFRETLLPYIYKTALCTWYCLEPYIREMRRQRKEAAPAHINYAGPFERLVQAADDLRKARNEARPVPV